MNMAGIIDFHTHILPGIDDGSKNVEQSCEMLGALKAQGVSAVVLTPHFYTHKIHMEDFLKQRQGAWESLRSTGAGGSIELRLGAELYLTDYIFNYEDITPLCITGTRYLLTEMSFQSRFGASAFGRLQRLMADFNVTPILAHIERYPPILQDRDVADELLDMGCVMQVNVSSLAAKPRIVQKRLLRMIEDGDVQLLGTDCHNMDSRKPDFETGLRVLKKKLGQAYLDRLIENGKQVFLGEDL